MSDSKDSFDSSEITEATVQDVVRALRDCKGHYSFLIGAGTSRPADIPTAGDLIWEWKQERFVEEQPDVDDVNSVSDGEIENWAESYENDHMNSDNEYGFWFEEVHTTPGQRRHLIQKKVENKNPTFGNIVLASLMADQYVPLTLTPNFDDLVYDALYRFLEEKPLVINHDAVAAEFSLTKERPMIIKLHGDYLFENLQNLDEETENLQENMERAFSLALNEYGLIVVGYGGTDKSIMDEVLLDDIEIPEYGIYWCARDQSELSEKATQLLEKEDTYFVEIDGSEAFFTKLAKRTPGVSPPSDDDLRENAEKKIEAMERTIEQREKEADSVEEEEYLDALQYRSEATELVENEEWEKLSEVASDLKSTAPQNPHGYFYKGYAYSELGSHEKAIEQYNKAIEIDPEYVTAYNNRGHSYNHLGKHKRAIEDYNQAIKFDPEYVTAYVNRAEARLGLNQYDRARDDAEEAYEIAHNNDTTAMALLLLLVNQTVIDEPSDELEHEFKYICNNNKISGWRKEPIINWLKQTELDDEKDSYIRNLISLMN